MGTASTFFCCVLPHTHVPRRVHSVQFDDLPDQALGELERLPTKHRDVRIVRDAFASRSVLTRDPVNKTPDDESKSRGLLGLAFACFLPFDEITGRNRAENHHFAWLEPRNLLVLDLSTGV